MEKAKVRDKRFDLIKGIAISLVVIGHILQFSYEDYGDYLVFNIIWTLQIPLFMVISGYFAGKGFTIHAFAKKAKCYLIPFFSCFLICELLIRNNYDLITAFKGLAFNLEASLWYLFVLFELSIVHMLAVSLSTKINSKFTESIYGFIIYSAVYACLLLPFVALAMFTSTTFLGSKYVLYYSLFYWGGFAWRNTVNILNNHGGKVKQFIHTLLEIVAVVSFLVYFIILLRVNIFKLNDDFGGIVLRFTASVCGVFLVIKTVFSLSCKVKRVAFFLETIGQYTLEIYYIHYLFIPYIEQIQQSFMSPLGLLSVVIGYFAVLTVCAVGIIVAESSPFINLIVFGKDEKNRRILD